jgi:hypothetical protein
MRRSVILWASLLAISLALAGSGVARRLLTFELTDATLTPEGEATLAAIPEGHRGFGGEDRLVNYVYRVGNRTYRIGPVWQYAEYDGSFAGTIKVYRNSLVPGWWSYERPVWSYPGIANATSGLPAVFLLLVVRALATAKRHQS